VLQRVAVCCSVLQCGAVCCSIRNHNDKDTDQVEEVGPSVLQCVAMCGNVLQCVAVCCSLVQFGVVFFIVLQCVAVCCPKLYGTVMMRT